MMIQRLVVVLLVMVVILAGCKDESSKMVLIPSTATLEQKKTFNRVGEPIVKTVEVEGPNPVPFYMDVHEVTVGQFKKFLKSTDRQFRGSLWGKVYKYSPTDKHPMIYVSLFDATAYAKWVGKRLPTEKEWEFAARGGSVWSDRWPWDDDESVVREYANFRGTGGRDKWDMTTAPVGSFRPNGYGLYDMAGNVEEWCQDYYGGDKSRVSRGGSWKYVAIGLRDAYRSTGHGIGERIGFRCAKDF